MTEKVVVLGAGYAGAGAIKDLESACGEDVDITWISDRDYHFVLHESHRCIRDPTVQEAITIPVEIIKSPVTSFREGTVTNVDTDDRVVELEDESSVEFDYLLVALGSRTAFFGIDGLETYAHTLKNLDDALGIHNALADAARAASASDPARIVVGGAGLSGIQTAGEIAEYRDDHNASIEIHLVEGLDEVLPNGDPELQYALRKRIQDRDITIKCGEFIGAVDEDAVYLGDEAELAYDELIWTGGITGREAIHNVDVDKDERSYRINAGRNFQTSDDRIFAIGDCALIDQPGDRRAPPTAQAAWQAAEVAGVNIARQIRGQPLKTWTHEEMGTVVSIGERAVAHDVSYMGVDVPIGTFGGFIAKSLKKAIAAKWINSIAGPSHALKAWPDM